MALLTTSSIVDGNIIYAENVNRTIQALNGASAKDIILGGYLKQGSGTVSGANAFGQGSSVTATGNYSHAQGTSTQATNTNAHAEGTSTLASGQHSHAEGDSSTANTTGAHAEGKSTLASGLYSHAEGELSRATNRGAHAEGYDTRAVGQYSHAEGYQSDANGNYSHAEGNNTTATGQYSHAEGDNTTATNDYSHAEGIGTVTGKDGQTAVGTYNKSSNSTDLFVIGDGASAGARSDAFGVSSTRTFLSNSIYLPDLGNSTKANVVSFDTTTGQLYYMSTSSIGTVQGTGQANWIAVWNSTNTVSTGSVLAYDSVNKRFGINLSSTVPTGSETLNVSGNLAVGGGTNLKALGANAVALNIGTIASGAAQTVVGQYNLQGNNSAYFIVGVGNDNSTRADGLVVSNTGTIISNSVYLPNLANTAQANIITYNSSSGILSYITTASLLDLIVPAGPNGAVQFKSGSNFSGSANFVYDYNTNGLRGGAGSTASTGSFAWGSSVLANGPYSVALGIQSATLSDFDIAGGAASIASGSASFAYGFQSKTNAWGAFAYGYTALAGNFDSSGNYNGGPWGFGAGGAFSVGYLTKAIGSGSVAIGNQSLATDFGSWASGQQSKVYGRYSFAHGLSNTIYSPYSIALGYENFISSSNSGLFDGSVAMGLRNSSSGQWSTTIGQYNSASGNYSFALGYNNRAAGDNSFAGGYQSLASGSFGSFAFGLGARATNTGNGVGFAVGQNVLVSGDSSVGIGRNITASGNQSITIGEGSQATNQASVALGYYVTASNIGQTVVGTFNSTPVSNEIFTVGGGSAGSPKTSFAVIGGANSSIIIPTQSAAPGWTGREGEIVPVWDSFGSVGYLYVYIGGSWKRSTLS